MKKTKKIKIGDIYIGGTDQVLVQSMTNTDTSDVLSTVRQIKKLEKAGCEIIRCSVPDMKSCEALLEIKKRISVPLIADIHFDHRIALKALENGADKIRINPGNMKKKEVLELVKSARDKKRVIRIGVNSGSLGILRSQKSFHNNVEKRAELMVSKVSEYINDFEKEKFNNIVVSLKASDIGTTINAYKLFNKKFKYPVHIGITEAGPLFQGSIKSSVGLGMLLSQGIGDTIRVSLSADPVWEVRAGYVILQSLGLRRKMPEIISCPTCARTTIDVINLAKRIENIAYGFDWSKDKACPIKIAVMGCVVNGPGEAKEADIGICGAGDKICFFKEGKIEKKFSLNLLEEVFIKEIKKRMS
ncbi:flavodoxin-dependent (E)-4-hydroxy-3-methylbut-2-enyl-diphosphate synthase [bacterium]